MRVYIKKSFKEQKKIDGSPFYDIDILGQI